MRKRPFHQLLGSLLAFFLMVPLLSFCQAIKPEKTRVMVLKGCQPETLVGLRIFQGKAFLLKRNGVIENLDLIGGRSLGEKDFAQPVLDFTISGSGPIVLSDKGTILGDLPATLPSGPFEACTIESDGKEILLLGGRFAERLALDATGSRRIPDLRFLAPVKDGFFWTVGRRAAFRNWHAELVDGLGNRMKEVYRFAREFDPSGVTLGPVSPEGELLISFCSGNGRDLALIGQNGRMFWKISAPPPICPRDLAWDPAGNLLVLEKEGDEVVINRWTFATPEG